MELARSGVAVCSSASSLTQSSPFLPRNPVRRASSHPQWLISGDASRKWSSVKASARDSVGATAAASATSVSTVTQVDDVDVSKLSQLSGVMTDETVPEGHKGLHGFLYGDDGADVHDAEDQAYSAKSGEDDGSQRLPLDAYVASRDSLKIAAVYAVYDSEGMLQYVGYARNAVLALKAHLTRHGSGTCSTVRVKVFTQAAMVTRARLEEERQVWLAEEAEVPPGNGADSSAWDSSLPAASAMTEAQRTAYEEKKLKMRKAMGENLHDDVEGESLDAKERRLRLLQAVEGDDWSSVINTQTSATLPASSSPPSSATAALASAAAVAEEEQQQQQIVSPFLRPNAPDLSGNGAASSSSSPAAAPPMELNVENADKVLDEVRPYLIADGGNVEVVGVDSGIVLLRLQGACGTCPSSTATMKMGLERALRAKFGDAVREVLQVDKVDTRASVEGIDSHLDMLRPAIKNFGGFVEVISVDPLRGICDLKYKGPPPVGMGIQAAVKDKFPDIRVVNLREP